jgi:hypothetical protein
MRGLSLGRDPLASDYLLNILLRNRLFTLQPMDVVLSVMPP